MGTTNPDFGNMLGIMPDTGMNRENDGQPPLFKRKWNNLLLTVDEIKAAVNEGGLIFSGGASNYIRADGEKERNENRDLINSMLSKFGIKFFDPQIHPKTHGRDYDGSVDGDTERLAREESDLDLYEINDKSLGAVTMIELVRDLFDRDAQRVVYLDYKGADSFKPLGLENEKARLAHYNEYLNAGRNFRDYFKKYSEDPSLPGLTVVENMADIPEGSEKHIIPANKLAASELLEIYHEAKKDPTKEIYVYFEGPVDAKGRKILDLPSVVTNDSDVLQAVLDDYVAEGKKMRAQVQTFIAEHPEGKATTKIARNKLSVLKHIIPIMREKAKQAA
jgi:hypothetical protein